LLIKDHDHKNINNGEYDYYDKKNEHNDEDHFHAIYISVLVLVGFLLFFITEKLATYYMSVNDDIKNEKKNKNKNEIILELNQSSDISVKSKLRKRNLNKDQKSNDIVLNENEKIDEKVEMIIQNSNFHFKFLNIFNKLSASGWLNLLADSMHNFTDGVAIGKIYQFTCIHKMSLNIDIYIIYIHIYIICIHIYTYKLRSIYVYVYVYICVDISIHTHQLISSFYK
jgi:Sec-independent protein translocase protein TatA